MKLYVDSALKSITKIFGFLQAKEENIDVRHYQRMIKKLQRKNQVAEDYFYYEDLLVAPPDEKKAKKYLKKQAKLRDKFRDFEV